MAELGAGKSRQHPDRYSAWNRQAWIAAMLLLTLPGTLTMYYGEELGMLAPIRACCAASAEEMKKRILVLLRMTTESGTILASTELDRDRQKVNGRVEIKAAEGMVIDLDS